MRISLPYTINPMELIEPKKPLLFGKQEYQIELEKYQKSIAAVDKCITLLSPILVTTSLVTFKKQEDGNIFLELDADEKQLMDLKEFSKDVVTIAYTKAVSSLIQKRLDEIVADDNLTKEEMDDFLSQIRTFNVTVDEVRNFRNGNRFFMLYYLYLLDTHPDVCHVDTGLLLEQGEMCLANRAGNMSELHEWRKKRTTLFYAGPRYVIPTGIKGLTYRIGAYNIAAPSHDELSLIDYGGIYFTNRRFIFDGEKKNVTIKYKDVLKYEIGRNFVSFEKANGKSIVIKFKDYGNDDFSVPRSSPVAFRNVLEKYIGIIQ